MSDCAVNVDDHIVPNYELTTPNRIVPRRENRNAIVLGQFDVVTVNQIARFSDNALVVMSGAPGWPRKHIVDEPQVGVTILDVDPVTLTATQPTIRDGVALYQPVVSGVDTTPAPRRVRCTGAEIDTFSIGIVNIVISNDDVVWNRAIKRPSDSESWSNRCASIGREFVQLKNQVPHIVEVGDLTIGRNQPETTNRNVVSRCPRRGTVVTVDRITGRDLES